MGIAGKPISYIECGISSPENIFKLAAMLDISLDEYIYGFGRFDETIQGIRVIVASRITLFGKIELNGQIILLIITRDSN